MDIFQTSAFMARRHGAAIGRAPTEVFVSRPSLGNIVTIYFAMQLLVWCIELLIQISPDFVPFRYIAAIWSDLAVLPARASDNRTEFHLVCVRWSSDPFLVLSVVVVLVPTSHDL